MIDIKGLSKQYGNNVVLDIEQLNIQAGETVGIVGNNGAGKTTLFNLMLDLIAPTSGEVRLKGTVVKQSEDWKKFSSAFIDETFIINFLTPDEYFEFLASLYNWSAGEVSALTNQFSDFYNDEIVGVKKYVRDLSKGNQKKVGLTGSFIGNPEILIWDEPFSNLDPSSQARLKQIINERKGERTWLISSHDLNHISEICTRIIILEKGKIVEDLQNGPEAIERLNGYFMV